MICASKVSLVIPKLGLCVRSAREALKKCIWLPGLHFRPNESESPELSLGICTFESFFNGSAGAG